MSPEKSPAKPRPRQRELAFQADVLALCEDRNLWPLVVNPARFAQRVACNQGFPDLEIHGPGGVLYRELKMTMMPGRGPSPKQITWRNRIQSHGGNWDTWTPRDLRDGRIERELAEIETPGERSDKFALAMLGVQTDVPSPAPAAAGDEDQGDEPVEDDEDPGDEPAENESTRSKPLPWLLAGAVIGVAVAMIKPH